MDKSVRHPGTFAGIKEKIPYLKTLGINAVELMPIFEFDELQGSREVDGKKLIDYWGYNTVSFFCAEYELCSINGIQPGRSRIKRTDPGTA